jgi:orotate phosphoribosyltransferase
MFMSYQQDFVAFAIAQKVIRFGEFKTKAGRLSPYFFNAGLFNTGESMRALCGYYAQAILDQAPSFDFLFGPAYKGIPLAAGVAMALAERGHNLPWVYNRKEAKDHGEGGVLVGAEPVGRALIIDDVISAGTSVRESVEMLKHAGATPVGVVIALDRQEKGQGELSAAQEVGQSFGIPVCSIATLKDLMLHLEQDATLAAYREPVAAYRKQYGV